VVNQVNNYYSDAESDSEPEDEFSASASISDTGFSVSRRTDGLSCKNQDNAFDRQGGCQQRGRLISAGPVIFSEI
jgi:hypothetical protein